MPYIETYFSRFCDLPEKCDICWLNYLFLYFAIESFWEYTRYISTAVDARVMMKFLFENSKHTHESIISPGFMQYCSWKYYKKMSNLGYSFFDYSSFLLRDFDSFLSSFGIRVKIKSNIILSMTQTQATTVILFMISLSNFHLPLLSA